MSDEEAQEEPAKVQEGGEPDPLTLVLDRLETINLTLFQIDQRLQEVEKPPLPRSELKELDSRRNSHDGLNISQVMSLSGAEAADDSGPSKEARNSFMSLVGRPLGERF